MLILPGSIQKRSQSVHFKGYDADTQTDRLLAKMSWIGSAFLPSQKAEVAEALNKIARTVQNDIPAGANQNLAWRRISDKLVGFIEKHAQTRDGKKLLQSLDEVFYTVEEFKVPQPVSDLMMKVLYS